MRQQRGFTLIELLVTMAVAAVVLGIAVPSFTAQIRNNQSLAIGEEFVVALNYARSEAVKRGARVSICPRNDDGDNCGNDWTNGWLVFLDQAVSDTANAAVLDDDEQILRSWDPISDGAVLTVTNGGVNRNFIRFTGLGVLGRLSNQPIISNARIVGCTGNSARQISVLLSGSVNASRADCP